MDMNRRDFLKICLTGLAGLFVLRWVKWFDPTEKQTLTEARFYRSDDELAG